MNIVFKLWAIIIGLVSTIHMLVVFYSEAFLHHSWTFYETNIPLATIEFGMALTGLGMLIIFFVQLIPGPSKRIPKHKLTPQERLNLLGRL